MENVACDFELTATEKAEIAKQLSEVDPTTLSRLRDLVRAGAATVASSDISPFTSTVTLASTTGATRDRWLGIGLSMIAEGKVAALLLAGGQGTRLGYDKPKGMYNLGLPSGKSLFQLQAERIIRVQDLACMRAGKELSRPASLIHWYVLTSDATHDDTAEYFARMGNFGLDARCVHLFRQGMLPALDSQGRVLLDSRSRVALSPNGNAGVYQALVHSGALAQMESSGVEVVFQYGVDNVLVSVCDPIFVGFVADSKADCAAKVVPKAHPDEPVGVLCMRGGKPAVAEYSEISKEARHLRDASGNLVYSASHICVNAFSLPFLKRHALSPLPFHVAFKKVPYAAGPKGELVNPPASNAYKAEMFIFDMFQYAERMSALLVPREIEFSPLKNPSGSPSDCPETCRASLYSLHTSWLRSAGAIVDSSASNVCEISPLVTFAGEGLESVRGRHFVLPLHLAAL